MVTLREKVDRREYIKNKLFLESKLCEFTGLVNNFHYFLNSAIVRNDLYNSYLSQLEKEKRILTGFNCVFSGFVFGPPLIYFFNESSLFLTLLAGVEFFSVPALLVSLSFYMSNLKKRNFLNKLITNLELDEDHFLLEINFFNHLIERCNSKLESLNNAYSHVIGDFWDDLDDFTSLKY